MSGCVVGVVLKLPLAAGKPIHTTTAPWLRSLHRGGYQSGLLALFSFVPSILLATKQFNPCEPLTFLKPLFGVMIYHAWRAAGLRWSRP